MTQSMRGMAISPNAHHVNVISYCCNDRQEQVHSTRNEEEQRRERLQEVKSDMISVFNVNCAPEMHVAFTIMPCEL